MSVVLALAALIGVARAQSDEIVADAAPQRDRTEVAAVAPEVTLGAGLLAGYRSYRHTGPMLTATGEITPQITRNDVRLRFPLSAQLRETPTVPLREGGVNVGVVARFKPVNAVTLTGEMSARGIWRPGWDDLYQPLPARVQDGPPADFEATPRYSQVAGRSGIEAQVRLGQRHTVRLRYRFTDTVWAKDGDYQSLAEANPTPTHLVPGDAREHAARLRWGTRRDDLSLTAQVSLFSRRYGYRISRDASTGLTHAGARGLPPNPLQVFHGITPSATLTVPLRDDRITLSQRIALPVQRDTFDGYYSYVAVIGASGVTIGDDTHTHADVKATLEHRRYGPKSYAATPGWVDGDPGHPPLRFGDRRVDQRLALDGTLTVPVTDALDVVADAALRSRRTNFPDYRPGAYPAHRNYDVSWSYTTLQLTGGVRWRP